MITGYIFTSFLIILGLVVMKFGSIHVKKFKEGKTKIKSKLSGQISFLILFLMIIGLIVAAYFFWNVVKRKVKNKELEWNDLLISCK